LKAIQVARRSGFNRLALQKSLNIQRQAAGGFETVGAVLFEGLHYDPIQIAANEMKEFRRLGPLPLGHCGKVRIEHRAQTSRWALRLLFPNGAAHFIESALEQVLRVEGRKSSEQFVQQYTQAVDVA